MRCLGLITTTAHLALALAPSGTRAQTPCIPVANVTGDAALARSVQERLAIRGVPVTGKSACGSIVVALADLGGKVRVNITDPDGRRSERVVADVDGAVAIGESWARRDVVSPLLARPIEPPALSGDQTPSPSVRKTPPLDEPDRFRGIELAAVGEGGMSGDGALWTGARAEACFSVKGFCLGALVRYARDTGGRGPTAKIGAARSGLDLIAMAQRPLRTGRFTLSPGAGIGQASVFAQGVIAGMEDRETETGLTARAQIAVSYAVVGAWALRLDVAGGFSPFVRTTFGDATDTDPALPAAPRASVWLGLGLTYGGL